MPVSSQFDLFNPNLDTPPPVEAIRYSNGIQPDQSLGSLFSGLGDVVQEATKGIDSLFKQTIREDATQATDAITSSFTGQGPPPVGAGPDSEAPDEINRTAERLSRLTAGVRSGSVLQSHYWGLLDAEARRLRSKYPGYREHIDNVFQDLTGSVPANALRRALFTEATARANSADNPERIYRQWEQRAITETPFGNQVLERKAAGNPMSLAEIQGLVAQHVRGRLTQEERKRALELQSASGNADRQGAMRAASDAVWSDLSTAWQGTTFRQLMQRVEEASRRTGEGGAPQLNAQEQAAITQLFSQFRVTLNDRVRTRLSEYDRLGLHADDRAAIMRNIETTLKNLEEDVTAGRSGVLALYKAMSEGITAADRYEALNGNDTFRNLNVLRDILGPNAIQQLMMDNPDFGRSVQSSITRGSALSRIFGSVRPTSPPSGGGTQGSNGGNTTTTIDPASVTSVEEATRRAQESGAGPTILHGIRRDVTSILLNPQSRPEVIAQAIQALYGPRNFTYLQRFGAGTARGNVFAEMTRPEIAKRIWDVSESTGNPSLWTTYNMWATNQAASVARQATTTLVDQLGDTSNQLLIKFDPATGQLSDPTLGPIPSRRPDGSLPPGTTTSSIGAMTPIVRELNRSLLAIQAIGRASNSSDTIERFLRTQGLKIVPDPANPNQMILRPLSDELGGNRLGGPEDADAQERALIEGGATPPPSTAEAPPSGGGGPGVILPPGAPQGATPEELLRTYQQEGPRSAADIDAQERAIVSQGLEEARRSMSHWSRLLREAESSGDTEAATRYRQRLVDVEQQMLPMEQRVISPSGIRVSQPTSEVPSPGSTSTATQQGTIPVTRVIPIEGAADPLQAIQQHSDAEVGAVLRVTVSGSNTPIFFQKTPQGWLLLSRSPQSQ